MNIVIERYKKIKSNIDLTENSKPINIVAISKTFPLEHIMPLIKHGHIHFGENKVQETQIKWSEIKKEHPKVKLHMVGKLQSNKAKKAAELFDYIHSLDNQKLAKKIADEQLKINKKIKIFLQVNIGDENQKSGINKNDINKLATYCKELNLDLIGLMCIPPVNIDPEGYFYEMSQLNKKLGFI